MAEDKDITLADIFAHLRGQTVKIDALGKEMKEMHKRFDGVDKSLANLKLDVNLLFTQTKNLVDELDIVETVQLPKMKKSIRRLSKRFSDHITSPALHPVLQA